MKPDISTINEKLDALPDPYRRNALKWLERSIRRPLRDPDSDMQVFLDTLPPEVQAQFKRQTHLLLQRAVHYFGK
jgi:hypothetical protein